MKTLVSRPSLLEQVHKAILTEIVEGRLRPGTRVIQEELAARLGVSRQPVQQALVLLRNQGVLRDAPGRGLQVAGLDPEQVRNLYEMRAVLEGLAFRKAAERNRARAAREGPALIAAGRKAVADRSVRAMIVADMAFHDFIYELAGNPLIAPTMEMHWTNAQRVMGEVLLREHKPRDIWDQHAALLDAVGAGEADEAERLARAHILSAADFMIERLAIDGDDPDETAPGATGTRGRSPRRATRA